MQMSSWQHWNRSGYVLYTAGWYYLYSLGYGARDTGAAGIEVEAGWLAISESHSAPSLGKPNNGRGVVGRSIRIELQAGHSDIVVSWVTLDHLVAGFEAGHR
jgi:hypothetical protein